MDSTPDFFLEAISRSLFHKWILPQDIWGLKSEFSLSYVSCQRLSIHTCPFASYTAGNSVPNMWISPMTKSLDTIVVTALRVGFPGESHGPATCGISCNCPEPEALTMEASGQMLLSRAKPFTRLNDRLEVPTCRYVGPPTSSAPTSEAIDTEPNRPPHLSEDHRRLRRM